MKHNQSPEGGDENMPRFWRAMGWLAKWFEQAGEGQVPLSEGDLVARYPSGPGVTEPITELSKKNQTLATAALNVWRRSIYRPEVVLYRETLRLVAASTDHSGPRFDPRFFEEFYMAEANDRLHRQTGPVIVAEAQLPTPSTEVTLCRHCDQTFYGQVVAQITAAECATDINFTLNHYRGILPSNLVQITEPVRGEIRQFPFTNVDKHLLEDHPGSRPATRVANKIYSVADYMANPMPQLEDPRYVPGVQ